MIPSPAGAWLSAADQGQGSAQGKVPSALPPSKPRQSSSPASSVDRDAILSIGRSGIKGGRTPPTGHAQRSASRGLLNSGGSGCKFSFGKCMLTRNKSSPLSFMKPHQQQSGCSITPNLILGTKPAPAATAVQHAEPEAKDTAPCKDSFKVQAAGQDLDLQHHNTCDAVNATIQALTEPQRHSVQRLLCNPDILGASDESRRVLAECPNLSFLILSLDTQSQAAGPLAAAVDLWPKLRQLMVSLHNVVCLDISNCLMQDSHLQVIAENCLGLRALDVSYSPAVTAEGLGKLLASCSNLEELDVSTCPAAISDQLLQSIANSCPKLSSLYIELDGKSSGTTAAVSCGGLAAVAAGCKQLQVLSLAGLQVTGTGSAGLRDLAGACPQLVSLDVTGCNWPSAEDWKALAGAGTAVSLSSLQTLSITISPSFDSSSLLSLAQACSGLVSLSLEGGDSLTDAGLLAAASALPQLTELTLASSNGQQGMPHIRMALAETLAARGVCLIQGDQEVQVEVVDEETDVDAASSLDLAAMDLDSMASPAPRGQALDGEGTGPEPMSVARSEAKASMQETESAGAPEQADAGGAGQPSWTSVMNFLASHVTDVQMASCQKARRPH